MIVFDLQCSRGGHVFEAWFASTQAYEDQRQQSLLSCPMCGDGEVGKALMAPSVSAKSNRTSNPLSSHRGPALPAEIKAQLVSLARAQAEALEGSTWVGSDFDKRVRAMESGSIPSATIHGQATLAEAKALIEDGIEVVPLPLPVVPPKQFN